MEFDEFNLRYKAARAGLLARGGAGVDAVQDVLRSLLADLPSENDREVAERLIDGLPALTGTRPGGARSTEMEEAERILDEGDFESGTTEERLTAIEVARRQIWAIADRAGADSSAIRGLTRGLESLEKTLEEGLPWTDPPGGTANA